MTCFKTAADSHIAQLSRREKPDRFGLPLVRVEGSRYASRILCKRSRDLELKPESRLDFSRRSRVEGSSEERRGQNTTGSAEVGQIEGVVDVRKNIDLRSGTQTSHCTQLESLGDIEADIER